MLRASMCGQFNPFLKSTGRTHRRPFISGSQHYPKRVEQHTRYLPALTAAVSVAVGLVFILEPL
jgi:hypothetical protein